MTGSPLEHRVDGHRGGAASREQAGPRLDGLTSLRLFAALGVVLFHAVFAFGRVGDGLGLVAQVRERSHAAAGVLLHVAGVGSLGPNFFFVLSGFILTYKYASQPEPVVEARTFWRARVARIYPVYLLALLFAIWHRVLIGAPCHGADCSRSDQPITAILSVVLLQGWLPWTGDAVNGPAWTLSAEAFFYALFPLGVVVICRARSPRRLFLWGLFSYLLTQAWLVIGAASTGVVQAQAGESGYGLRILMQFSPLMRVPEFLLGIVAARLFAQHLSREWPTPAVVLISVVVPLTVVLGGVETERLGWSALAANNGLFDPLFALLIVGIAQARNWLGRIVSWRPAGGAG